MSSFTEPYERLQQYYPFDEDILDSIDVTAYRQNQHSFTELAEAHDLADCIRTVHPFDDERSLEYLLLTPTQEHDEQHVRVLYNNMATPIDESTAMRAMRLFDADPTSQLMVVGNPAAVGNKANLVRKRDLAELGSGRLAVLAETSLRELAHQNIQTIDVMGYSLGADIAATATSEAIRYDMVASRAVWAEPVVLPHRSSLSLVKRFVSAGKELDAYVAQADSRPLMEARAKADTGLVRYVGGLLRASNLVTTHALAQSRFFARAERALTINPQLTATIARGDQSEICDPVTAQAGQAELYRTFRPRHIGSMVLAGMHHAGCDDIDLHAAIMLQGLRA